MVQKLHNSAQVELIKISLIILKYMVKSYRGLTRNQTVSFIGFPI